MSSRRLWLLSSLIAVLHPVLGCGPPPRDTRAGVDARRDTLGDARGTDTRDGQSQSSDRPIDSAAISDAAVAEVAAEDGPEPAVDGPACPGQTLCGTTCVDVKNDPANCGGCGMACPAVENGKNLCAEGKCAPVCDTGFHACGDDKSTCYADDDAEKCGLACTACPTPANGAAACEAGMCKTSCQTGFHLCGTACVANTSVTQCGAQCTACQPAAGLNAACIANQCRSVCPGAPTVACTAPANGTVNCSGAGNTCGFACTAGFCKVGAACMANDTVEACGASCTKCMARAADIGVACKTGSCVDACNGTACPAPPANGRAICNGSNACDFACNTGFHRCGSTCVADDSATQCGSMCKMCEAPEPFVAGMPAGGVAACKSNTCTVECEAGRHACLMPDAAATKLALTCIPDATLASCGPSCAPCPGWAETCALDAGTGKYACAGSAGPVPSCEAGAVGCHLCKDECPANWQVSCVRAPANPDGTAAAEPTRCCNPARTPICCDPAQTDPAAADFCDP